MGKKVPFGSELELSGQALDDAFSARALLWQVGGAMVAALCLALAIWLARSATSPFVAFLVIGVGFVLGYTLLAGTGCIVCRVLENSAEGKGDGGMAPLHFLIDNIGAAVLLPMAAAAAVLLLALATYLLSLLWYSGVWQAILVIPSLAVFVVALGAVCDLFALLFIVPSMVVTDQPSFTEGLRRVWRLFWAKGMTLTKTFVVGVAAAVLLLAPVLLAVSAALFVVGFIYLIAGNEALTPTARFVLHLYRGVLLWAPVCTLPLAFLNALALRAHDGLFEGLELEEEDLAEEGDLPEAEEAGESDEPADQQTDTDKVEPVNP